MSNEAKPRAWLNPKIVSFAGCTGTNATPEFRALIEGEVSWSPSLIGDAPPVTDKHGVTHRPTPLFDHAAPASPPRMTRDEADSLARKVRSDAGIAWHSASIHPWVIDAIMQASAGQVRDEAKNVDSKERENAVYSTIERALRCYRMSCLVDDEGEGLPMADAFTPSDDKDISTGLHELDLLRDHIAHEIFSSSWFRIASPPHQGDARDAERWRMVRKYFRIDDIGDENCVPGLCIDYDAMGDFFNCLPWSRRNPTVESIIDSAIDAASGRVE